MRMPNETWALAAGAARAKAMMPAAAVAAIFTSEKFFFTVFTSLHERQSLWMGLSEEKASQSGLTKNPPALEARPGKLVHI